MKRLHLFEFHEKSWFPPLLRDCTTEYLHFIISKFEPYRPLIPELAEALNHHDPPQLLDLCSGASGGIAQVQAQLEAETGKEVPVFMSDKFPNKDAFEHVKQTTGGKVDYIAESVDVMDVPTKLRGMRTLFNAFHHFRPAQAQKIIDDAVSKNVGIGIFEANDRSIIQAIFVVLLAPIMVLVLTPFIKPFRISRLIFTYLIPILPLLIAFDGMVSILRVYLPEDLEKFTQKHTSYIWKKGKIQEKGMTLVYLIGRPE